MGDVAHIVLPPGLERVAYDAEEIARTVRRLAAEIARDTVGEPLLLVGVLKGALFLTADLARALAPELDVRLDTVALSSYGKSSRSSGHVTLLKDVSESVRGRHVVIVEDILDGGLTLRYLRNMLAERAPASLRSCVLLERPKSMTQRPEYVGFPAPEAFIVGYGLDYQEKYRHLPYLATLRSDVGGLGESSVSGSANR